MESSNITINEEWIRKKLNITHDNLEDIKTLSLAGTYQEKISHLGNSLHKFTRLKELDLSRNCLVSLEGLENCKHLEKLNLYYNNIFSLKELERLKHNTTLSELDLRLNPITKEENDYRLHLIQLLPSLKICDDRAIRDSERQMAIAYFEQSNPQHNGQTNGQINNDQHYQSNGVMSRVKSVSNIAKRSAGINENDHCDDYSNFRHENGNYDSNGRGNYYEGDADEMNGGSNGRESNHFYRSKSMQNLRPNENQNGMQRQKSVHFNDVATYQDINGRCSSDQNLNLGDEAGTYALSQPRGSFTPNPHYDQQDEQYNNNNKREVNREFDNEQKNQPDEFKSTLFLILDLVDRYWNGSKSLHQNYKFLGAANQLLKQYSSGNSSSGGHSDDSGLMVKLKSVQDENKRLQHQLQKISCGGSLGESSNELQYKNYLQEIDILKKKLNNALEENKNMHKEFNDRSDKLHKEYSLESIENQNGAMKRDNEIMKIKLKQYEQLQALTSMLQESHKSLVTTNDHLLQEINNHKRDMKMSNGQQSRYMNGNTSDTDLYSPTNSTHESNSYGQPATPKQSLRKQYEQLNNSLTTRYGFQKC